MRIKFLLLIISFLILIGCNSKENLKEEPVTNQTVNNDFKFEGFPAYSITKDIDAIVFEMDNYGEEKLFYNQIYDQVEKEDTLFLFGPGPLKGINSTCVDTTGQLNIFRNEKLEKRIKQKLKPSYYVYGTKGFTKVNLGDVYFTIDECLSNIIAVKLNNYERKKYGNVLFCSEKPLNLVYGKNYKKEEKAIHKFEKKIAAASQVDYSNPENSSIIFANNGSNYFTYEDDFNWKKDFDREDINFPSRAIYHIDNKGKVSSIWGKSLDLYGIPCD